eukprot:5694746-Karenia_brevis.AAC.1
MQGQLARNSGAQVQEYCDQDPVRPAQHLQCSTELASITVPFRHGLKREMPSKAQAKPANAKLMCVSGFGNIETLIH